MLNIIISIDSFLNLVLWYDFRSTFTIDWQFDLSNEPQHQQNQHEVNHQLHVYLQLYLHSWITKEVLMLTQQEDVDSHQTERVQQLEEQNDSLFVVIKDDFKENDNKDHQQLNTY